MTSSAVYLAPVLVTCTLTVTLPPALTLVGDTVKPEYLKVEYDLMRKKLCAERIVVLE